MVKKEFLFSLIIIWCLQLKANENLETFCNINGKRAINYVSEKFLSISIDPAVLLVGVNLSENSIHLARHLRPAYIRLAGPSTEFVKYADEGLPQVNSGSITITPSTWFGINEWLTLTNLTPIFALNDVETIDGMWNPKSVLPLLDISDKLNVSCYWQLGYDSSNKTDDRYKLDLSILRHILDAFPDRNETWKIVGSDISHISEGSFGNTLLQLKDIITAVVWEPHTKENTFLETDLVPKMSSKLDLKIWTSAPKASGPIAFSSALQWAKQTGEAARIGYNVIFRQLRMHELFTETPAYWFSVLHKNLMGSNVLEAKTTTNIPGVSVYAHCSRNQNSFVRRGALSVLIINENEDKVKIKVVIGNALQEKTLEVQEYTLTSTSHNSTDCYLNGILLCPQNLLEQKFFPKVRRAKMSSHISLGLPTQSIGYFVLSGARIPICVDKEVERELLLEEIESDQNALLSEEIAATLGSRSFFDRNYALEDITRHLKNELMLDENYYSNPIFKSRLERTKEEVDIDTHVNDKERARQFFTNRAKVSQKRRSEVDSEKRRDNLRVFLMERAGSGNAEFTIQSKSEDIKIPLAEVEKKLKEMAKYNATKRHSVFTDQELDALIRKASNKFLNGRLKKSDQTSRIRRDINLQRLKSMFRPIVSLLNKVKEDQNVRLTRKPKAINSQLPNYKSRLEDYKIKLQDRRDQMLGGAQKIKERVKSRRHGSHSGENMRFRRYINIDLLKTKSEVLKKKVSINEPNKFMRNLGEKEATIRKPGQTSAELLEDLKKEMESEEIENIPIRKEVFAELAKSVEESDEKFSFTTHGPKKLKIFDKKPKIDPFTTIDLQSETTNPRVKNKKNRKLESEETVQFLTASEEFTDVEDDLPCIHELFGEYFNTEDENLEKTHLQELGEFPWGRKTKKIKEKKTEVLL